MGKCRGRVKGRANASGHEGITLTGRDSPASDSLFLRN